MALETLKAIALHDVSVCVLSCIRHLQLHGSPVSFCPWNFPAKILEQVVISHPEILPHPEIELATLVSVIPGSPLYMIYSSLHPST